MTTAVCVTGSVEHVIRPLECLLLWHVTPFRRDEEFGCHRGLAKIDQAGAASASNKKPVPMKIPGTIITLATGKPDQSPPITQRIDQHGKSRRGLSAARVIEVIA